MTPEQLWNEYKTINPTIGDDIDAWAFGVEPDQLADLVLKGEKTVPYIHLEKIRHEQGIFPSLL